MTIFAVQTIKLMAVMNSIINTYAPITLDEMKSVRLMNRVDTKFVTTMPRLLELLELLEVLEASTFNLPYTLGGYPQTAGIRFTVDAAQAYDAGAAYPNSTYCRPNSIRRVTVESIGGKPFDPSLTYAVVTNDFLTSGGDTAYLFGTKEPTELGVPLDELLIDYITQALGGVLSAEKYGQIRGDQTLLLPGEETGDGGETASEAVTYTVVAGDCLWNLARRYYGSGRLFGRIAEANGIAGPYTIYVGQTLRIPAA